MIGAGDDGRIDGQLVSDKTRREIAAMLDRFEPPASVDVGYVDLPSSKKKLIVLDVKAQDEACPFTFDGRAYRRVQSTTSVMPQDQYEQILLDRAHARRRWENQPAVDVRLEDLDHEEILRNAFAAVRESVAWLDRTLPISARFSEGDILREDRLPVPPNALREIILNAVMTGTTPTPAATSLLPCSTIVSKSAALEPSPAVSRLKTSRGHTSPFPGIRSSPRHFTGPVPWRSGEEAPIAS